MRLSKFRTIYFFVFTIVCCTNKEDSKDYIGYFDVSNNDKRIVFSYLIDGKKSSIYEMNLEDNFRVREIISNDSKNFFNPKYSPNGDKIIFLESDQLMNNGFTICISNSDGSGIERVTNSKEIISSLLVSRYSNKIIYTQANSYGKSSPISNNQAKGTDIYSVDLFTKKVETITNFNSFGIYSLFELDSLNLLAHITGPNGGMFQIPIANPYNLKKIIPKNNPRKNSSLYYSSVFSEQYNLLVFEAPYEIYTMNMHEGKAQSLYYSEGSQIKYMDLYNKGKTLLFLVEDKMEFFSINIDGTDFKEIPISIASVRL